MRLNCKFSSSKGISQSQLDQSRFRRTEYAPEVRVEKRPIRIVELRVVKDIEEFSPELQLMMLRDVEVFHHVEIGVKLARAPQGVPSNGSEIAGAVRRECGRVEPLREQLAAGAVLRQVGISQQVRTIVPHAGQ